MGPAKLVVKMAVIDSIQGPNGEDTTLKTCSRTDQVTENMGNFPSRGSKLSKICY